MLELKRSDIGFGRIVIDDSGVTRHGVFSTTFVGYDEIEDYRLTIGLTGHAPELLYLIEGVNLLPILNDVRRGMKGEHRFRFGIELVGRTRSVSFNWRFRDAGLGIAAILKRITPRLSELIRAEVANTGAARFGTLHLSSQTVQIGTRDPLRQGDVESIELFDSSPIKVRVMKRGKVLPYGTLRMKDVPRIHALFETAEAFGYPVKGRNLLAALGA